MGMLSDREFWELVAKYGKDFLQSTSNNIASQVSVPVDASAWLLRKAGVPIPATPMLSSEWMKNAGITPPVEHSPAAMAGEVVGGLAPTLLMDKAPQIAKGMLKIGENAMMQRTLNPQTGAIVWHGSPHKFNKFDSSKIGTGEGAQAYGHGLYFAESPSVAQNYKIGLTNPAPRLTQELEDVLPDTLKGKAPDWADEIQRGKTFSDLLATVKYPWQKTLLQQNGALKKIIERQQSGGSLYKVDLPDSAIAKMLDWDKPLSQQNNPSLKSWFDGQKTYPGGYSYGEHSGKTLYEALRGRGLSADQASNQLRQAGIPGIRYLDGGSRGAGAGTSNYVVFTGNEDILTILERNGMGILDDTAKMAPLFP